MHVKWVDSTGTATVRVCRRYFFFVQYIVPTLLAWPSTCTSAWQAYVLMACSRSSAAPLVKKMSKAGAAAVTLHAYVHVNYAFHSPIKHCVGRVGDSTMHVKEVTLLGDDGVFGVRRVQASKFWISAEQLICCKSASDQFYSQRCEKIVVGVYLEIRERKQREGKQIHASSHERAHAWRMVRSRAPYRTGVSRIGLRYRPQSALADTPPVAAVISVESANNHIGPSVITPSSVW